MKIIEQYSLHNGFEILSTKNELLNEISEILNHTKLSFGVNSPKEINKRISERFNQKGWADKVKVGNSNLTISFLKAKVGICFQIGNVARTYADILKLSQLFQKGIIDVGVIIVPHKFESKMMGANYAQFERLIKELAQFKDIVNSPIFVLGMSN